MRGQSDTLADSPASTFAKSYGGQVADMEGHNVAFTPE